MFNHEFNCQKIFKQESRKITNKIVNQARMESLFFMPSKKQVRQRLLEKTQSRSIQEFCHQKAGWTLCLFFIFSYSMMVMFGGVVMMGAQTREQGPPSALAEILETRSVNSGITKHVVPA